MSIRVKVRDNSTPALPRIGQWLIDWQSVEPAFRTACGGYAEEFAASPGCSFSPGEQLSCQQNPRQKVLA
jgi:hypothetical protein